MEAEINNHTSENCSLLFQALAGVNVPDLEFTRNALWETYRFAINGGLVENGEPVSAEDVALLFDQLIALVREVEALRKAGGGAPLSVLLTGKGEQHV